MGACSPGGTGPYENPDFGVQYGAQGLGGAHAAQQGPDPPPPATRPGST
jgi:hypothetical protein